MCGIAVIVKKNIKEKASKQRLLNLQTGMKHRGPDSSGLFIENGIGLSMVRLAIVDQETGDQPIWNEDHSICTVCNGEIYNYKEHRDFLIRKGHTFSTGSDVEIVLHLYEEYGVECVRYLEGIFAFAIWDQKREFLFVARDQIGVKPLFFLETNDEFVLCSEISSLLKAYEGSLPIQLGSLSEYHSLRFVSGKRTLIEGVEKIPPAHYAIISDGSLTLQPYWNPSPEKMAITPKKLPSLVLMDLFEKAVKSQETVDVNAGLFLSGGLDSSILLHLQEKLYHQIPHTFTVGFEKPKLPASVSEYDEIDHAKKVAQYYRAQNTAMIYSAEQVLLELPRIIADLDEPIADPTSIPLWFVCRLAKERGCKVVYSGEGLDELFYGYAVYNQAHVLERLQKVPVSVREFMLRFTMKYNLLGRGLLNRSLLPTEEWYQGVGGIFTSEEKQRLFADGLWERKPLKKGDNGSKQWEDSQSIMDKMASFDFHNWLPDNTLAKSDKISMAHSLELRVPFLNRDIVEFALSLPENVKRRGNMGKYVVREAFKNNLCKKVFKRRKTGFPVPVSPWIFGEWNDYVCSLLLDPRAKTRHIYKTEEVERLLSSDDRHRERAGRLLWAMLTLELWLQNHSNVTMAY
jgi:asparagine synthase (glutamine-hydrolysing)